MHPVMDHIPSPIQHKSYIDIYMVAACNKTIVQNDEKGDPVKREMVRLGMPMCRPAHTSSSYSNNIIIGLFACY